MPVLAPYSLRGLFHHSIATGLLLAFFCPASEIASASQSKGPSTSNPDNALWVTLEDRLSNWRTEGEQQYSQIASVLKKADNSEKIGYKEVEDAYLAMLKLGVLGARLSACGEVAGIDFRKRSEAAETRLVEIAKQLASQPENETMIKRQEPRLNKAMTDVAKKLDRSQKQAKAGDYDKACNSRFGLTFPIRVIHLWWYASRNKIHPTMVSWNQTRRVWISSLQAALTEQTKTAIAATIEKEKVNYEELLQQLEAAASQITASGQYELPGSGLSAGPNVIEHFGQMWIEQQAKAYRWRGMVAIQSGLGESVKVEDVDKTVSDFSDKIGPALASIVDADAQRATPEQAFPLYDEYLQAFVPIVGRTSGIDLTVHLAPALDRLAAKNPDLNLEVAAYRACTEDLLRWRRLTVDAYVRANSTDYVSLKDAVLASVRDRDFPVVRSGGVTVARNNIPVPVAVSELAKVFLNEKVSVNSLSATRQGKLAVSPQQSRSIAYVPINRDWFATGYESLSRDLFVTDDSPPITLEARLAIYHCQQGDVSHTAGDITNVGLIGWTTRLLTLDPRDPGMARLGPFSPEPVPIRNDDLTIMFMIRPAWVANGYTFISLIDESKN